MHSHLEILLIEDLADDRDLICHLLNKQMDGSHITCEDNHAEVIKLLRQKPFDVIIIDYFLAGYTGLDLIDEIRDAKGFDVPIIMITADETEEVAMKSIQHGVDDFIVKTLKGLKDLPDTIYRTIKRADIHKMKFTSENRIINTGEIFQNVYEKASELIFTVWPDGSFVNANDTTLNTLGINRIDLDSKNFVECIDSNYRGQFKSALSQLYNSGRSTAVDLLLRNSAGKEINVSGNGQPQLVSGKVIATNWIFRNVTFERYTESLLWDDYKQYAGVFDYIPVAVTLSDHRGVILQANKAACTLLGYHHSELQGTHIDEITHPDDKKTDLDYFNKLMSGELDHYIVEKRFQHKSGAYIWVEVSGSLVKNSRGESRYGIAHIKDITELKNFEELLGKLARDLSRAKGESIFDRLTTTLVEIIQSDYVFICYVSKEPNQDNIYTLLLRDKTKATQDTGFMFPHELLAELSADDELVISSHLTRRGTRTAVTDKLIASDLIAVPLRDDDGRVLGILGSIFKHPIHKQSLVTTLLRIAGSKISAQLQYQETQLGSNEHDDKHPGG